MAAITSSKRRERDCEAGGGGRTAGAGGEPRDGEPGQSRLRAGAGAGGRHGQRADSADDGGEQHRGRRHGADAESESGERADRAEHARGSDVPDSGRDQGAGGAGSAEDLHAAGGGGDRAEDRERPAEPVRRLHGEHAGGNGGDGDHGSGDRRGGDGAVPGEGSAERSRSIWWWTRPRIRRCGRFRGSANSRRRATRGCGR